MARMTDSNLSATAADIPADAADKTIATILGEIVWLMSRSDAHKASRIADLEAGVMPAVLLRQFKIFYSKGQPVAAVLYARLTEERAKRFDAGDRSLVPDDWASGRFPRIVDTIAPFGDAALLSAEVLKGLRTPPLQ